MGNLIEYLRSIADKPFQWGVHDCLIFANDAVKAQRGTGWADEWVGGYATARQALVKYRRAQRLHGTYDTIIDAADDRLWREATLHPAPGNVVAFRGDSALGWTFGIGTARGIAVVGDNGLEFVGITNDAIVWSA